MKFVSVPHGGSGLPRDLGDRCLVERTDLSCVTGQRPSQLYGPRASFLKRGIIEKGIRVLIQNLVAEGGGLGRIDRVALNLF